VPSRRQVTDAAGHRRDISRPDFVRRGRPRLFIAVVSVAALALVIALALAFGPQSSTPRNPHGRGSVPASRAHSTVGTNPASTTPYSTTTTPTSAPSLQLGMSTEQITYEPFNGALLEPTLHVAAQESGTCFQYGGGAQGRYLYRCGTLQPCIAGSQGTNAPLACPVGAHPETNDVIVWNVTSVDTTGFTPATAKTPFAMQLSNGVVCVLVNAAWSGLGPFSCDSSSGTPAASGTPTPSGTPAASGAPADCRQPQSATPYWTTVCQDQLTQSSPFTPTTVVRVWL
jgi:hypothetical protein